MAGVANAASLASLCTTSNVQAALPADGDLLGLNVDSSSVYVEALYNQTLQTMMAKRQAGPGGSTSSGPAYSYCQVNVTYSHTGADDTIELTYVLPDPSIYESRFYVAGGEAYSLTTTATGGLEYGAASGVTGAGWNGLAGGSFDEVVLLGNGTVNWNATYQFGYQALGEMTMIGQVLTQGFYSGSSNTSTNTTSKLYTYFEGCSDGGRQAMSQAQRWPDLYDGVIAGAPAFRVAQQQSNHLFPNIVEHTLDYYPPPCALEKILNLTIAACDPLDGKTDGVIARSDLCQLQFNLSSTIGEAYYCAAGDSSSLGFGFGRKAKRQTDSTSTYDPAQNGTVNANDVAVAQTVYDGLKNSAGEQAYLAWQIGAELDDAETQYSNETMSWELDITSLGGEFVAKWVELLDLENLSTLDGVTYDTLVEWMTIAYFRYTDSLQTTLPDLTPYQQKGGKLLHYHGESDPSVPTASSVHYWQSVREVMYGIEPTDYQSNPMSDWYQLYLVSGAAHCAANDLQPEGPFPENNMATMIAWVEQGVTPQRLNATASGNTVEPTWELCQWPQRPLWSSNSSESFSCVYDQSSYDTWTYNFTAFKVPIY